MHFVGCAKAIQREWYAVPPNEGMELQALRPNRKAAIGLRHSTPLADLRTLALGITM